MSLPDLQTGGAPAQSVAERRLLCVIGELAKELQGTAFEAGTVTLTTHFESELGFDSLARAELLSRIEQMFGVQLPVDVFARADCANDLLRALCSNEQQQARPGAAPVKVDPAAQSDARVGHTPVAASTLCEALQWYAAHDGERMHLILVDDSLAETRVSYGELHREALEIAGGLRE